MEEVTREEIDKMIKRLEEELEKLTPGTDNYHRIIEGLNMLYRARIEDDRQNAEAWEKQERLNIERAKSKSEKIRGVIDILLKIGKGIGLAVGFGFVMKLEESGVITTKSFNLLTRWVERDR